MFSHILVPTDLTDRSMPALVMAGSIAREGSIITLFHVIETIPGTTFDEFREFYQELERKAVGKMAEQRARLSSGGRDIRQEIAYGRRAEEIIRYATERDTDLIVLASHRLDVSKPRSEFGTISYKVGLLSPCPVLLVK